MTDALASAMRDYVHSPMRDRVAIAANVVAPLPCGCRCRCRPAPNDPWQQIFIHVHGELHYEPCCFGGSPQTWPHWRAKPGPIQLQVRPGFEPYQQCDWSVWAGNVGANEDAPDFVGSTPHCGWQPWFLDGLMTESYIGGAPGCAPPLYSEGGYLLGIEGRCGSDGAWLVMSTQRLNSSGGVDFPAFVGRYSGDLCASTVVITHAYEGGCPAPQQGVFQGRLIAGAVMVLHTTCSE